MVDEVSDIIKDSIEHSIGSQLYQQSMVNKWTNSVVENCLTRLCKLAKPFKYIGKVTYYSNLILKMIKFLDYTHIVFILCFISFNSDMRYYAKKWCWFPCSKFLLLGQLDRWQLYCKMGKQNYVCYCVGFWPCYIITKFNFYKNFCTK